MAGPGPDPLLYAGERVCGCGGEGWPVDAAWLAPGMVLAVFQLAHRGGCRGPRVCAAVLDLGSEDTAMMPAPRGNAQRARAHYRRWPCRACWELRGGAYCTACRCRSATARGDRCRNKAAVGGLCSAHQRLAARQLAGPDGAARTPPPHRSQAGPIW
jgi:hypothetical protein